jgi:hypothetical protein
VGIPVVPGDQPTPVVQPAMTPFHFPAELADVMNLRGTARLTTAVGPLSPRYGGLNPPSSQSTSEISTVIALVSSQTGRTFLGTSLRSRHPHPVYYLQPHGDLSHISRRHQKSQGQAITFSEQMDSAALAFPAIGYVLSPFLAGTKLPSRKAWLQSNLPCWSSRPKKLSQIRSQTPCSCHSWRRRWQVDRLPYFDGKSFQRAPDLSTQTCPELAEGGCH